MSELLQANLFESDVETLTPLSAASRVRTFQLQGRAKASTPKDQGFIGKYIALQRKFDREFYCLKMSLLSELEARTTFSYHWRKSITSGGLSWSVIGASKRLIKEIVAGSWPSVQKADAKRVQEFSIPTLAKRPLESGRPNGWNLAEEIAAEYGVYLTPNFAEWMMGFPKDWTLIE